ncbi:DUF4349 domain-containing protein [Isoptericola sediminis]|uniref:DUF4349 domain-containing protein n=1 Tax=Isoptericola sediminis TaxID=2733572 RepID=A0A849KHB9_9MICO|nr:DUF4349 domain-containing protein [Isoptericola sediminis]NNU28003.1 DUF4349 domain-containing protein [Isoptericola sediminis]
MPTRALGRRATALTIAAILTFGLAACTGSDENVSVGVDTATDDAAGASAADAAAVAEESVVTEADRTAAVDREVVVTGWIEMTSPDPSRTTAELTRMVEGAGGRVDQLSESPDLDGEPGPASMTVRIPAARTTSAVEALSELATVQHVEVTKDDVTSQGQNLDARISALTTSTKRLDELLSQATSTEDLLEVERELAARQAELDSLVAQREALSDQVAMSTLHIQITPRTAPVTAPASGFVDGLETGWSALVAAAKTVVLVLGVLLPWLLPIGAVGLIVWFLRRRRSSAPPSGPGRGEDDPRGPGSPAPSTGAPDREPELVG